MRGTLEKTLGNVIEIIVQEANTLDNEPYHLKEWALMALGLEQDFAY
jgi:hypothetical protein